MSTWFKNVKNICHFISDYPAKTTRGLLAKAQRRKALRTKTLRLCAFASKPVLALLLLLLVQILPAQTPDSIRPNLPRDTGRMTLNMDAVYNRPFLQFGKIPVALGGYVEADVNHAGTDGISEGTSFRIPRMTIFLSSALHRKIKFLSEIEFEEGTKEINIEFASLDLEFHPLLNLRGGIVMNPIGAFNQNHDGPKWDFIDRPISAIQMLPATWSNVGAGLHGKLYRNQWVFAYEAYLTNGFDDSIVANDQNRTSLPAAKENRDRFEESSNGIPLFTGKVALRHRAIGEIGLSHMGGVYNKFEQDGLQLDARRRVDVWAVDFNTTLRSIGTRLTGEWAWVAVDVPASYSQQFGRQQQGGFLDIVQPVLRRPLSGFQNSEFHVVFRMEYVDWNVGSFSENDQNIGDDIVAIVPGLAWRPTAQTVFRLNYRYSWQRDLLGNPPAQSAAIQLGLASYF